MKYNFKLVYNIVTFFKIGKIKYAPGTFGSLAAFPIFFLLYIFNKMVFKNEIYLYILLLITIVSLFNLGVKFSNIYVNKCNKQDPSEIVIDEVVGQLFMLSAILPVNWKFMKYLNYTGLFWYFFIGPFFLFRIFDIIKPWPISWFDQNIKNGMGVMLDDLIAAIFAIVIYYNIYLLT